MLVAKFEKNDLTVLVHQVQAHDFQITLVDSYAREIIGRVFYSNCDSAVAFAKELTS